MTTARQLHCGWLRTGLFVFGLFRDVRPIRAIGPIRRSIRSIRPKWVVRTGGLVRTGWMVRTGGLVRTNRPIRRGLAIYPIWFVQALLTIRSIRTDGTVWTDGTIRRGLAICPIWFVQALLTIRSIRTNGTLRT